MIAKVQDLFNNFFASICTPVKNASVFPLFSCGTNARIKPFVYERRHIINNKKFSENSIRVVSKRG